MHKVADALHRAADAVQGIGLGGPADAMRRQAEDLRRAHQPQTPRGAGVRVVYGIRPKIRVVDWWRGGYVMDQAGAGVDAPPPTPEEAADMAAARAVRARREGRLPAREQVARAKERVRARRARALERMGRRGPAGSPAPAYASYTSRPNGGVKTAFIMFMGVLFVGAMVSVFRDGGPRVPAVVIHRGEDGPSIDMADLREAVAEAAGTFQQIKDEVRSHRSRKLGGARLPEESRGQWLVVDDLADSLDETERGAVDASLARMEAAGAEIVGRGSDEQDVETLAAARAALGVASRTDDADAKRRLRSWLESERGDLAGALWFARKDEAGKLSVAVIAREGIDAEPVMRVLAPRRARKD
jgi:hypothetical protein